MATPATLLPDPAFLHLARLEAFPQNITAIVTTISSEACCPSCQCSSEKVHSRYVRLVADLPWTGWAMRLELRTRSFFCLNAECPRQIFTERLPSVVAPYARRTTRLTNVFSLIGFALIMDPIIWFIGIFRAQQLHPFFVDLEETVFACPCHLQRLQFATLLRRF